MGGAEKMKRSVLTVPPTIDRTDGLNKFYSLSIHHPRAIKRTPSKKSFVVSPRKKVEREKEVKAVSQRKGNAIFNSRARQSKQPKIICFARYFPHE